MTTTPITTLIVRCYPGEAGEAVLYEDDGQTDGYLKGACAWTKLRYRCDGTKITVTIGPAKGRFKGQPRSRSYRIELPCTIPAAAAMVNGAPAAVAYEAESWMNIVTVPKTVIAKTIEVVVETREIDPAISREQVVTHRAEFGSPKEIFN